TSPHSIVEIAVDDMPFLVDSLGIVLGQENLAIHLMIHPVLSVRRDRAGRLLEIAGSDADLGNSRRESWQHIQIDRIEDEAGLAALARKIESTLEDVRLAVQDWSAMRQRALDIAAAVESQRLPVAAHEQREAKELLEWMTDNHFTFLGYREYRLKRGRSEDIVEALPQTGLGILRRHPHRSRPMILKGDLRAHARAPELLTITKANSKSTV